MKLFKIGITGVKNNPMIRTSIPIFRHPLDFTDVTKE